MRCVWVKVDAAWSSDRHAALRRATILISHYYIKRFKWWYRTIRIVEYYTFIKDEQVKYWWTWMKNLFTFVKHFDQYKNETITKRIIMIMFRKKSIVKNYGRMLISWSWKDASHCWNRDIEFCSKIYLFFLKKFLIIIVNFGIYFCFRVKFFNIFL